MSALIKRVFDLIFATMGLLVITPFVPIIGALIKFDSKGPVFYATKRVGQAMVPFKMYKFRTMYESANPIGPSLCAQHDPRVTVFGRFLRRTKLNELPQLLNILLGQMTFVGPRPEAPDLADLYPQSAKKIFSVKPGLVGPATILGRNEEECYPPGVDVKRYYIENILPEKLTVDLGYIDNQNILKDFRYVFMGIKETVIGAINKKHLHDNKSQILLFIADCLFTLIVSALVLLTLSDAFLIEGRLLNDLIFLSIEVSVRLCTYFYFGIYSSLIRYLSYTDIKNVIFACLTSSLLISFIATFFNIYSYSGWLPIVDMFLLMTIMSALRFCLRLYWEKKRSFFENSKYRRVLLYGADDAGYLASCLLTVNGLSRYHTIGFIDDNPVNYGKKINGFKVLGDRHHLKELVKLYHINEVIITTQNCDLEKFKEIILACRQLNIECRVLPFLDPLWNKKAYNFNRKSKLTDILPLSYFCTQKKEVTNLLSGKSILFNGTGGALGTELIRKLLLYGCRQILIVDQYEAYLNETLLATMKFADNGTLNPILLENINNKQLDHIFNQYRPQIVINTAIRKYEPYFQNGQDVLGTKTSHIALEIARLSIKNRSELFVQMSSLNNCSNSHSRVRKQLQYIENSLLSLFKDANTRLVIPQLCDVAENRGGILHLLEEQIANHGIVVLPSEKSSCNLISKASASEYILHCMIQANSNSSNGSIFRCNAGWNITLLELTKIIAAFHGLDPWTELEMHFLDQPNIEAANLGVSHA